MDGAQVQSALLWAGDFAVELNEYKTPSGRPRRTDRHVGEAGIYHFALHFNTREDVERSYRYALQAGHASNTEPIWFGLATVAYMRTNQSFVVEYLQFSPWIKRFIGFGEPSYRE